MAIPPLFFNTLANDPRAIQVLVTFILEQSVPDRNPASLSRLFSTNLVPSASLAANTIRRYLF